MRATRSVGHTGYTLSYSEPHEQAEWVVYMITAERLRGDVKRKGNFRVRSQAIRIGSEVLGDYKGSGYDRGISLQVKDSRMLNEIFF